MSQHGANMEPTWSQLEANLRGGACYCLEGFSEEANLGPTWPNLSQLGANLGQHDPNLSQLRANLAKLDPSCFKKIKLEAMLKLSYITIGKQKNYIPRYPKLSNMTMHHPRPGGMRGTVE